MLKLIITGATGTAGAEAVRQALAHPSVAQVTVLSRRPLPAHIVAAPDPKLNVIIHSDFATYPPALLSRLADHNAVLWDLGISSAGFKEAEYEVITKDYAVAAARAFAPLGTPEKKFVFCYLSGQGSDQEGKAWAMFGRVKGRAEKALALMQDELPTLAVYSFRPAGIFPVAPIPEAGYMQRSLVKIVPVIRPLMKTSVIDTTTLAKGMIEVALNGSSGALAGWEGKGRVGNAGTFGNEEIKVLAGEKKRI